MPSVNEQIVNKKLSGAEVKQLILEDFKKQLDNDGALADIVAYGRITWRIILRLQFDNFYNPESSSWVDARPKLDTPVEAFPLSGGGVQSASELTHEVTSPNVERIRAGIPVPAEVKQYDGTTTMENIVYPKDMVEPVEPDIQDVTEREKGNWESK